MSGPAHSLRRRQCLRFALHAGLAVSGLALAPWGPGRAHAMDSQLPASDPTAGPQRLWRPMDLDTLRRHAWPAHKA